MQKAFRPNYKLLFSWLCLCLAVHILRPIQLFAQDAAIDLERLPLGDGKSSTEPKAGYLWSCDTRFDGGGAFLDGPWIKSDGTWDRTLKITVDGAVEWPNAQFEITIAGDQRIVSGNGLPEHPTGIYPVQSSDDAYQYDRNPNSISAQTIEFVLAANPTLADTPSCAPGIVGIMITGIPIFNAFDAEGRDAAAHEIQDDCDGHPEVTGQYHYHDLSSCIEEFETGDGHSPLVGYAFDGFGIYGFRGEDGQMVTNADLDDCHGHTHTVEWDGQMVEMYHYHATAEFPYSVGCFRGTPAQVRLSPDSPQGGQQSGGSGGQPPQGDSGQPPQGGQGQPPQGPPPGGGNPPPPPPAGSGG